MIICNLMKFEEVFRVSGLKDIELNILLALVAELFHFKARCMLHVNSIISAT